MTIERREFKGNVAVSISDRQVRVWVCNSNGENIFRFMALGKVHRGEQDVIVIGQVVEK